MGGPEDAVLVVRLPGEEVHEDGGLAAGHLALRQLDAAAMSGDYAAWNYFQSIDSEENKKFVASFRKKYGPQRVVTDPMESSYFGVKLWAQAVAEVAATAI